MKLGTHIKKLWRAKGFSENIGNLVIRLNKLNSEAYFKRAFIHIVVVYLNVFGPGMKDRIGGYRDGTFIVTPKNKRRTVVDAKVQ